MFKIKDGREYFYQWDIDRKLIVEDPTVKEAHFTNRATNDAYVCETYVEDGITLVNVPNILLQTNWRIQAYAYDGKHTKHDVCYEVKSRSKPNDYVYTETEIKNYDALLERVEALEKGGASPEAIGKAVEDYLEENPEILTIDNIAEDIQTGNTWDIPCVSAVTNYVEQELDNYMSLNNITETFEDVQGYEVPNVDAVKEYVANNAGTPYFRYEETPEFEFCFDYEHNRITHNLGDIEVIMLTISDNVYPEYYNSEIMFYSGETPTMIVYTEAPILNWVGTDCSMVDGLSIFAPQANTRYDVLFYFNGLGFVGLVNGYKLATGNE